MNVIFEDKLPDGVTVVTVHEPIVERWTTAILGGPNAGWETTYRMDTDPAKQHAIALEVAKTTP